MRSLCPSYLLCSFRQRWMSSSSLGGTQCCWRARRGERPFASSCLMTPALTRRFAWTGWSATTSGCALVMSSGKTVFRLNFHYISWLIDRSWECCFSNFRVILIDTIDISKCTSEYEDHSFVHLSGFQYSAMSGCEVWKAHSRSAHRWHSGGHHWQPVWGLS